MHCLDMLASNLAHLMAMNDRTFRLNTVAVREQPLERFPTVSINTSNFSIIRVICNMGGNYNRNEMNAIIHTVLQKSAATIGSVHRTRSARYAKMVSNQSEQYLHIIETKPEEIERKLYSVGCHPIRVQQSSLHLFYSNRLSCIVCYRNDPFILRMQREDHWFRRDDNSKPRNILLLKHGGLRFNSTYDKLFVLPGVVCNYHAQSCAFFAAFCTCMRLYGLKIESIMSAIAITGSPFQQAFCQAVDASRHRAEILNCIDFFQHLNIFINCAKNSTENFHMGGLIQEFRKLPFFDGQNEFRTSDTLADTNSMVLTIMLSIGQSIRFFDGIIQELSPRFPDTITYRKFSSHVNFKCQYIVKCDCLLAEPSLFYRTNGPEESYIKIGLAELRTEICDPCLFLGNIVPSGIGRRCPGCRELLGPTQASFHARYIPLAPSDPMDRQDPRSPDQERFICVMFERSTGEMGRMNNTKVKIDYIYVPTNGDDGTRKFLKCRPVEAALGSFYERDEGSPVGHYEYAWIQYYTGRYAFTTRSIMGAHETDSSESDHPAQRGGVFLSPSKSLQALTGEIGDLVHNIIYVIEETVEATELPSDFGYSHNTYDAGRIEDAVFQLEDLF